MFWLPPAAFDSFRDSATDQCGVDRVWWNNTFSEEFTSWTKLEMWMCLGQPAVALVSFTFSMFNTKYAAISQGDSPSLIGELREKCKLTWRAMKESLIKLKKILMCCYNHNILSFTGTWYPFLSVSGIESYTVVALITINIQFGIGLLLATYILTHNALGLGIAKVDHFNLLIAKRASFLQFKSTNVVGGQSTVWASKKGSAEMKNTSTTASGKMICSISMWCYSGWETGAWFMTKYLLNIVLFCLILCVCSWIDGKVRAFY